MAGSATPPFSYTGASDILSSPENQMMAEIYSRLNAVESRVDTAAGGAGAAFSGPVAFDTLPTCTANPASILPLNFITKQVMDFLLPVGSLRLQPFIAPVATLYGMEFALVFGQTFLKANYADLFTAWGYSFDSALSTPGTSFRAPDFRGAAICALNNQGGADAGIINAPSTIDGVAVNLANVNGRRFGIQNKFLSVDNLPAHNHLFGPIANGAGGETGFSSAGSVTAIQLTTTNTGGNQPFDIVQPSIALCVYARVK